MRNMGITGPNYLVPETLAHGQGDDGLASTVRLCSQRRCQAGSYQAALHVCEVRLST